MSCHVMASRAMPGHIFACHAIFLRVMPCHEYSMPCHVRIFWDFFFENIKKYAPLFFLFFLYAEICWVAWAAWALADYSMANRKIAYTLGRGWACIISSKDMFPKKSWHGMAWNIHDTAWHAKIWHDTQKYVLAWTVKPWYGMAWHVAILSVALLKQ